MLADIGVNGHRFILVFFRVASVIWLLPIFSSKSLSMPFKAGVSLLIAFLLFENVSVDQVVSADPYDMVLLVLKETLVGLTIGFLVRILFMTVYAAGEVLSLQSGFAFARFMDPTSMNYTSVLEQFGNILAIMIFFALDAHHILLSALAASFTQVPVGAVALKGGLFHYLIDMTGKLFSLGLKIGAPVIVTLFLVELALGLLSRMIPQINVFVEGIPLKIIITLLMLSLSLNFMVAVIAGIFKGMDVHILRIFRMMV